LGGSHVAGAALKSSLPDWNGTNSSDFSALAGGARDSSGDFSYVGSSGYFWSSSPSGADAWSRELGSGDSEVYRYGNNRRNGFSVRCVRD